MRRYSIIVAPIAKKQIDGLSDKIKTRVGHILSDVLAHNPLLGKSLKADLKGLFSYRMGDYRIIYNVVKNDLIIQVIKVMHRKDVYR